MAQVTEQVARARAAARVCGFKRGEYSATTEREYKGTRNGYRLYEYGDLLFYVKGEKDGIALDQSKEMIGHGYDVSYTIYRGKVVRIGFTETTMPSGIGSVTREELGETGDAVCTREI